MGKDETASEFLSLVANHAPAMEPGPEEETGDGDIYATVAGQRTADVLRFIRQGGKPLTMPYGLLPIVWGDFLPELLLIEYAGFFTVRLKGHGLDLLEVLISERRVTRIRACDEATARRLPLAVTAIDPLRYYPSRELSLDIAPPLLRQPKDIS